jgi:large subunit ribosomal protein L28
MKPLSPGAKPLSLTPNFPQLGAEKVLASTGWSATFSFLFERNNFMARICELTGVGPRKGSHIWRSGKAKKKGGIGTHITAITKRRFFPNLQRVKAVVNGEVRYIRVTANAIKKGLVVKAPKRNWKKAEAKA